MNIHSLGISSTIPKKKRKKRKENNNTMHFNCGYGSLSYETSITTYSIEYKLAVPSST